MALTKNASIFAYFRRPDQPREKKRPSPDETLEESRKRARKKSPIKRVSNTRSSESAEPEDLSSHLQHPAISPDVSGPSSPQISRSASPALYSATQSTPDESASPYHPPISSQPPLTASRRIIRNGEAMVRNSDDESDASLEDIDDLLDEGRPSGRSSPKAATGLPSPDDETGHERKRTTRGASRSKNKTSQPPYALPIMPRKYKFSLEALLKQRKQDDASNDNIAKAKSMLHTYEQDRASTDLRKGIFDTGLMESVMRDHGDEDDVSKLKSAIQRTEALQFGKSWSFFDDAPKNPPSPAPDFPIVQDVQLQRLLSEKVPRQQAFLSGFASEYTIKRGLPEEILLWLMDAICVESRDDLRYSYTSTLKHARESVAPLLTTEHIDILFRKLGASSAALDLEIPIEPHAALSHRNEETTARPGLLSILAIIEAVSENIVAETRAKLLNTLCRLALDNSVIKNFRAVTAIEEAFASLMNSIPEPDFKQEIQTIMTTTYRTITDASLRLQLLKVIPSWSPRLTHLRRRLALAFFFQDPHRLNHPSNQPPDLKQITHHLQNPQFSITHTTDFSALASSIGILSIAIDSGDPPPLQPYNKDAETTFNKDVDSLAAKINIMFNDIVDTGASHMKRTEAKEVLEGFQRRLEYVVRTKPKPKKLIFGDSEVVPLQEKMRAFLDNEKMNGVPAVDVGP